MERDSLKLSVITMLLAVGIAASPFQQVYATSLIADPAVKIGTGSSGIRPQTAASGSNVYVVWQDSTTGNNDILFARSTDGGSTFGTAKNLSNNLGVSSYPKIATSGSNVYVVWQDSTTGTNQVLFTKSTDGGSTFGTAVSVSGISSPSTLEIAASGSNVYLVWQDTTGQIFYKRSTDGGSTFGTAKNLSNSVAGAIWPHIAATGSYVHVVWKDMNALRVFYTKSADNGVTFTTPRNVLSTTTYEPLMPPRVAAGGSSTVEVTWMDRPQMGGPRIMLAHSADGGTTFASKLLQQTSASKADPAVSVDATGQRVIVTWSTQNYYLVNGVSFYYFDVFYSYSTDGGATFSAISQLTQTASNSRESSAAVTSNSFNLIWDEYSTTTPNVFRQSLKK